MVEKDWSFERVKTASEEFQKANPDAPSWSEPISIWQALHDLDLEEQRYLEGDQVALLAAIEICAHHGLVMPQWVVRSFRKAYFKVIHFHASSWDAAFGQPHRKGIHLERARERHLKQFQIYNRVQDIRERETPRPPIDDALFERVGSELGFSKTVASELYYQAKRSLERFPETAAGFATRALLAPFVVSSNEDDTPDAKPNSKCP